MFAAFDNNGMFLFIGIAFFVLLGMKKAVNLGGGKVASSAFRIWMKRR
jgi:hypothetical protein